MKNIDFIFLRSPVTSSENFQNSEREKFLKKLNENGDFLFTENGEKIFFIETGGTEEKFKKIYLNFSEPFYLVATDANNSLPASLEIATFLKNKNKKFVLIHGTAEEVREQLLKEVKIRETRKIFELINTLSLKGKRFGVIGKPSDWLIASNVDKENIYKKLGAKIIDIEIKTLVDLVKKNKDEIDTRNFDKFLNEKINKNTLVEALKIYHALKTIILKERLDGITVRCFDLLSSLKNTSCLALALLNQDGYIATCEGDVPTMLTMALVRVWFGESSFQVNPSYINVEKRYAYLAHCTLPIDMCESYSFDTHFESGIGIGIKGKLLTKDVTIMKLNRTGDELEIFSGKIVENLNKNNLCRTQIKVEFKEDISGMLSLPNGNHLIVFYGDHKQELISKLS